MRDLLQAQFTVVDPKALPADVSVVKGRWPGIRLSPGGGDVAGAGPTGEPWVDSNGWRVRVAQAQRPGARVWVDAQPQASRTSPEDYVLAFADAAAHGARWIVDLDDALASAIAARKPEAMSTWARILQAAAFFTPAAAGAADEAVIGVLSSLTGAKVAFTGEVLNNLARTRQLYRVIAADRATPQSFAGLKGVIYTDSVEPAGNVRKMVLEFVNTGGMLITSAAWGSLPKGAPQGTHPRFAIRAAGQGAIAVATNTFSDPYRVPNDAVVLVSHRNDLVRYFNSGPITPCLYRTALHTVFYSLRPVDDASVWVKGSYRAARLRAWNRKQTESVRLEARDAGVEIYLPAVAQYASIELEA